jgi:hypothetical protein
MLLALRPDQWLEMPYGSVILWLSVSNSPPEAFVGRHRPNFDVLGSISEQQKRGLATSLTEKSGISWL